jgi:fructose-1,6-bisphosphatase/inositol monophosphatase family enzyme
MAPVGGLANVRGSTTWDAAAVALVVDGVNVIVIIGGGEPLSGPCWGVLLADDGAESVLVAA